MMTEAPLTLLLYGALNVGTVFLALNLVQV
jgi:hypothetical protein